MKVLNKDPNETSINCFNCGVCKKYVSEPCAAGAQATYPGEIRCVYGDGNPITQRMLSEGVRIQCNLAHVGICECTMSAEDYMNWNHNCCRYWE